MIVAQWPYFLILGVCILIFALFAFAELRLFWRQRAETKRKEQFERDLRRALSRDGFSFEAEPKDFQVTSSSGLKMGGMPEQIWVAVKDRYGAPIPYSRDDIVERIERREQSRLGHFYFGGVEVRADLLLLAELVLGGSKAAVDWFGRHHVEFGAPPASFLKDGGDEEKVARHLKSLLSSEARAQQEARL